MYECWSVNGFGICVDDIKDEDLTFAKLHKLCSKSKKMAKRFEEDIREYFSDLVFGTDYAGSMNAKDNLATFSVENLIEKCQTDGDVADFLDYVEGDYGECGLGYYFKSIIAEVKDIRVVYAEDYDCKQYLLITPAYPWTKLADKEKNLTEESVKKIFREYTAIFSATPIDVKYYSVPNHS